MTRVLSISSILPRFGKHTSKQAENTREHYPNNGKEDSR